VLMPSPPVYEEPEFNGCHVSMQTWRIACLRSQQWADGERMAAYQRTKRRRWLTIVLTSFLVAAIVVVVVAVFG
jgi:hypothetical protein